VRERVERVRLVGAVIIFSFVVKRECSEPVEGNAFQEASGNDAVGVDVVAGNESGNAGNGGDFSRAIFL